MRARPRFTGWTVDGGYADAITVPEAFAVQLPDGLDDLEAAPLLCAGVIGYRALRRAEVQPGDRVALLGFGASAHLALQVLQHWGCEVVVLTRGEASPRLARRARRVVGRRRGRSRRRRPAIARWCSRRPASWSRSRSQLVRPGGTVSLAGIHMSDRSRRCPTSCCGTSGRLRSVANMTRATREEFMAIAAEAGIRAEFEMYPLEAANEALAAIAHDAVRGAAVLQTSR